MPSTHCQPHAPARIHVLLLQGSAVMRQRIAAHLREASSRVVVIEAQEAEAALVEVGTRAFDLVVLDVAAAGEKLAALARLRRLAPQALIFTLCAGDPPELRARCEALGSDFCVDPLTELDMLTTAVEALARGRVREGGPHVR